MGRIALKLFMVCAAVPLKMSLNNLGRVSPKV